MSPVVAGILDDWPDSATDDYDNIARLAATLLVELLAYQFASPVQWIDTLDLVFGKFGVRRLVEVGASPVLSGIAVKTLRSNTLHGKHVDVLHIERDRDAIYYAQQRQEVSGPTPNTLPAPSEQPTVPAAATMAECVLPAAQPPGTVAATLVDAPLQTLDVVHALVAHKLKCPLADVSALKSIKALVGGKSTLQNEIVGDLHKEFGSKVPDKAEELSLEDLAAAIG
ncbi:3-oxoacyl-[acyl-carrier-protein] synthase, partial [Coemansia sp. RSA 2611]